jgi:hypothetical protein
MVKSEFSVDVVHRVGNERNILLKSPIGARIPLVY